MANNNNNKSNKNNLDELLKNALTPDNRRKADYYAKVWKSGKVSLSGKALKDLKLRVGDYVRVLLSSDKRTLIIATEKATSNGAIRKISAKNNDVTVSVGKALVAQIGITATTECNAHTANCIAFRK